MKISGLRSPYDKVGGLVYFGRMLDKIRLHLNGKLPPDYQGNFGKGFDARCCQFLGIEHKDVIAQVKLGGTEEDILQWCFSTGHKPTTAEIEMFNAFMRTRGWRDDASARLSERVEQFGSQWTGKIHTFFDLIEVDEERPIP